MSSSAAGLPSEHEVLQKDSRVAVIGAGSIGLVAAKELLSFFTDGSAVSGGLHTDASLLARLQKQLYVFERGRGVGGVWRSSRSPFGNAYDSLHTNSSKGMMELSDFPWSKIAASRTPPTPTTATATATTTPATTQQLQQQQDNSHDLASFATHQEVCRYFQAYCRENCVDRFISFNTEVVRVARVANDDDHDASPPTAQSSSSSLAPVSYTHLTLPTIYSV